MIFNNASTMSYMDIQIIHAHLSQIAIELAQPPYTSNRLLQIQYFLTCNWDNLPDTDDIQRLSSHQYSIWEFNETKKLYPLIQILYDNNQLTADVLRQIAFANPKTLIWHLNDHINWRGSQITDDCKAHLLQFYKNFIWDIAQDLSIINCNVLYYARPFQHSPYFVLATRHVLNYQITQLKIANEYAHKQLYPNYIIALMAETTADDIDSDEKRAMLIQQLRDVVEKNPTIDKIAPFKLLLPVAVHFRDVLLELIGWQDCIPLLQLIGTTVPSSDDASTDNSPTDDIIYAQSDPEHIHVSSAHEFLANIPRERVHELLSLIIGAGAEGHRRAFLLMALLGMNRADVLKKFNHHGLVAIKAYGLLPLEGDETVLSRYLTLKQSLKMVKKLGPGRKVSHANAVRVALDHLAQTAGYLDGNRLEWAMEAQLNEEITREWTIEGYTIQLEQDGVDVGLAIFKDGRRLKSVPKAVRGDTYNEAMETVKQLRAQITRLRLGLLEGLIASGDMLPRSDIETLLRLPIARALFPKVIWRNNTGEMGLLDVDQMVLVDVDGKISPVGDVLGVAHPYHLFQADKLGAWQRHIVHQRILQPIKQAFRELYIITPAEIDAHHYSNRFAGHFVTGQMVSQLLAGRGWRMNDHYDHATPYKQFGDIRAIFRIAGVWGFLGREGAPTTSDQIHFEQNDLHKKRTWRHEPFVEEWLPLQNIPPLIFSEVMRDADLVVSVAGQSGEARLSNEGYEARGQVITTLLDDLGLVGVRVDGHFAYVTGKLANYRVHLGSAVIHIDPGNYLCIVPAKWGMNHDKLFLPFVDEKDRKISEVISKILLLLADDKIKDESILRQIRR